MLEKVLPPKKNITAFMFALFCLTLSIAGTGSSSAQTNESYEVRRERAFALYGEGKLLDAIPLLEKLAAENQYDRDVLEILGLLITGNATIIKDSEARKKERVRGRGFLLKAKEAGSRSALLMAMLESIPPDGSISDSFSNKKDADEAMREAEVAFARGDMDKAFAGYQKALKADSNLYEAALFSGDTFLHKKEYVKAGEWYAKAIAINQDKETGYRYWGTALVRQNKMDEARNVYVESYICDPYNKLAINGLVQWSSLNNIRPAHPHIDIPADVSTSSDGNIKITVGKGDDKNIDGSFAWTMYGFARVLWQPGKEGLSEKFKKQFPNETKYRHSLAEELDGLSAVVRGLKGRMKDKDSKIKTLEPSLSKLVELYDKNLLEPYILLARADEGIAQDYYSYFKANRNKLRRYVVEIVLNVPAGN